MKTKFNVVREHCRSYLLACVFRRVEGVEKEGGVIQIRTQRLQSHSKGLHGLCFQLDL